MVCEQKPASVGLPSPSPPAKSLAPAWQWAGMGAGTLWAKLEKGTTISHGTPIIGAGTRLTTQVPIYQKSA